LTNLKIAIVSSSFNPSRSIDDIIGGGETYSLNLSKALAKSGNEVTLFMGSMKTHSFNLSRNLKIKYLKTLWFPLDTNISFELLNCLTSDSYDVIHANQLLTAYNILASFIGRLRRTPVVLTDHGGGLKVLALTPGICARLPKAFAAISNFSLNHLLHFAGKKKSTIIYGGVDVDRFHSGYETNQLKQKLKLDSFNVVLCVGRILPHKGLDSLIRAFRYLPSNTKLLVAGPANDPTYFEYIQALATTVCPGKAVFLGAVSSEELPRLYNVCDVFVQPSVYYDYLGKCHPSSELLGLCKLEAMACGKPVVVTNVGGLPELVVNGKNGYIVHACNEKELAQRISDLFTDENSRKRMGQQGLALILEHYTWATIANNVLRFYGSLIESN
jgi:glycosyltransferase involved in cell wall biosynthesis